MSRGFVKEDDQEEIPLVPQRAFLPAGVPNFVTKAGLELLLSERLMLITERDNLEGQNENEKRIAVNFINAKLQLLNDRISGARVVEPGENPQNEIRFGSIAKLRNVINGDIQSFQIVGVDEADVSKGKISFISPLSKALISKKAGEKVAFRQNQKETVFEILSITWP